MSSLLHVHRKTQCGGVEKLSEFRGYTLVCKRVSQMLGALGQRRKGKNLTWKMLRFSEGRQILCRVQKLSWKRLWRSSARQNLNSYELTKCRRRNHYIGTRIKRIGDSRNMRLSREWKMRMRFRYKSQISKREVSPKTKYIFSLLSALLLTWSLSL